MSDPVQSTRVYWFVFITLIVATMVTVAQARLIELDDTANLVIGLVIATTKATLVALFFMHLKYEKRYFYPVVLFPLSLLFVIIFSNFPDVAFGDHTTPAEERRYTGGGSH
jgi:cytochrome c oxidase subunit 4